MWNKQTYSLWWPLRSHSSLFLTRYVLSSNQKVCYQLLSHPTGAQHAGSNEWQQGSSALSCCLGACSNSSLQLLTDGGFHIIAHFRSVSNCLWWISIFTRHFVNSILVLPLGTHVRLPGWPTLSLLVLWNVRSLLERLCWHWLTDSDSWLDVNPTRANWVTLLPVSGSTAWSLMMHFTNYLTSFNVWHLYFEQWQENK